MCLEENLWEVLKTRENRNSGNITLATVVLNRLQNTIHNLMKTFKVIALIPNKYQSHMARDSTDFVNEFYELQIFFLYLNLMLINFYWSICQDMRKYALFVMCIVTGLYVIQYKSPWNSLKYLTFSSHKIIDSDLSF